MMISKRLVSMMLCFCATVVSVFSDCSYTEVDVPEGMSYYLTLGHYGVEQSTGPDRESITDVSTREQCEELCSANEHCRGYGWIDEGAEHWGCRLYSIHVSSKSKVTTSINTQTTIFITHGNNRLYSLVNKILKVPVSNPSQFT